MWLLEWVQDYSWLQILGVHVMEVAKEVVYVSTDFRLWRSSYILRQWHIHRLPCEATIILVTACLTNVFVCDVLLSAGDLRETGRVRESSFGATDWVAPSTIDIRTGVPRVSVENSVLVCRT